MRRFRVLLAAAFLLTIGCTESPPDDGEETVEVLEGLVASSDDVGAVRLSWTAPDPAPSSYTVKRDGVAISTVPGDASTFEDRTATPGDVDTPSLSVLGREGAIHLQWPTPATHPGPDHSYEVVANGASRRSATAIGSRRAPSITGYAIERDGAALASVDAITYEDLEASAGSMEAVSLSVRESADALRLDWTEPVTAAGAPHAYRVVAVTDLGESGVSAPQVARRAAPQPTGFRIERDGKPLVDVLGPEVLNYSDDGAEAGSVEAPALHAEGRPEAVGLTWADAVAKAGARHEYVVVAISSSGEARSATAAGTRTAPRVSGFSLFRDGVEIAALSADAHSYDDFDAEPATTTAPVLVRATRGTRADAVEVSWEPGAHLINTHAYRLGVLSDAAVQAASHTGGRRIGPAVIGYEVRRDGGVWMPAGMDGTFLDTDAPGFRLEAVTAVDPEPFGEYVELGLEAPPAFGPPAPSVYEVRAVTADGPGPVSSSVEGWRDAVPVWTDAVTFQWQRSDAEEGPYEDLSGLVDSGETDREPLLDTPRFYRVEVRAGGAAGWSIPARAEVVGLVSISIGNRHACGLRPVDGRAFCWGRNDYGATTVPTTAPFDSIVAGDEFTCGIRSSDKTALCWGLGQQGQTTPPPGETFSSLSADSEVACGIRAGDGTVVCWGSASNERLAAPAGVSFDRIDVTMYGGCGLRRSDGRVVCWGTGYASQPPPDAFDDIAANGRVCGIRRADKRIVCWGRTDLPNFGADAYESVVTSGSNTCGVRSSDRKIVCLGHDILRGPTSSISRGAYRDVIYRGGPFCAHREPDGLVVCWGDDSSQGIVRLPRSLDAFERISAGGAETCALRISDRAMVCWGATEFWDDGAAWPSEEVFESISTGWGFSCGIRARDGEVECFGSHANGAATAPAGPFSSVSAGVYHSCGIRAVDQKAVCWGSDTAGRAPPAPSASTYVSISAGMTHTCGIRAVDGKVSCWGSNDYGQAPAGPGVDAFDSVSAGSEHTCGIRSADSRVVCWGRNHQGQAPTSPSADAFSKISAGESFTCAIRASDGRVTCWGLNDQAQAPATPNQDAFLDVSAGYQHACGVRAGDRRVICWGRSYAGVNKVSLPLP